MVLLSSGPELLESAVSYALASAGMATPQLLSRATPCRGWDLETLLDHLSDSIGVLGEATATGGVAATAAPGHPRPGSDPVARLRRQAARLLAVCAAAGPAERVVTIGDRELTTSLAVLTGAIEITVHGWDIFIACGASRQVPPGLAAALLPSAALLVTPGTRPGLFAGPVRLPGPASPATSSSPSSAASRACCLRRALPEPGTGSSGQKARKVPDGPRRFRRIRLVYISRPPNERHRNCSKNRSNRHDRRSQTVLVTGANRGIGQALVEEALSRGVKRVYAGTRRPLAHPDRRVTPLIVDVTNAAQIQAAADQVSRHPHQQRRRRAFTTT